MMLLRPVWLLLLIPLALLLWRWRPAQRWLFWMRLFGFALVVLALVGPALHLPRRTGTVVIVVDRSLSMPPDSERREREAITLIQKDMSASDRLSVVSFGRQAVLEPITGRDAFSDFTGLVDPSASSLSEALETALSLIPVGERGRILIVSDGRWTGRDLLAASARAASRDIPIDYRALSRSTAGDIAISRFQAPTRVQEGEAYLITVAVEAPIADEVTYHLLRNGQTIASGKRSLSTGTNYLTFRDRTTEAGTQIYQLDIQGDTPDPVPENNRARLLVGVEGRRPLLLIAPGEQSPLAELLRRGDLAVVHRQPGTVSWDLAELTRYSGVILQNVPASTIGQAGLHNLAAWVRETGAGLMMTGGKASFGPGGYFKSPLDSILPVSMELRQEHRKFQLAIVVALDRSGSMAVSAGGGKSKMDLANLGTTQVLDLLSDMDEIGVIAVDSAPHTIVDLRPVSAARGDRGRILGINSMGGGIYVYEALEAAAAMLIKAKAGTRHIILFSDAADSENPGKYKELIEKCTEAGITISVIGLGSPTDVDAALLQDVAKRGGGNIYFSTDPTELPALFAQDTFVIARSSFLDEPTAIITTPALVQLTGEPIKIPATLGGYNLTYLRPEANQAAVTDDENSAPVLAHWQVGLGRCLVYTGELDGAYTGDIARWPRYGELLTSLGRWVAGQGDALPHDMMATQDIVEDRLVVTLHLDPRRAAEPFANRPTVSTLRGSKGDSPQTETHAMTWADADTLRVELPLYGGETVLPTLHIPGVDSVTLSPAALPYSLEHMPPDAHRGLPALEQLAATTGGKPRVNLGDIWKDMPRQDRLVDLSPWLLVLAIVAFLLEILHRRTGLLGSLRLPNITLAPHTQKAPKPKRQPSTASTEEAEPEPEPEPEPVAPPPSTQPSFLNALKKAQDRAQDRTKRNDP